MKINSVALQLQIIGRDTDLSGIKVGDSVYEDDIWDFRQYVPSKVIVDSHKVVKFGYIENKELKKVIKKYAYYKLGKIKPQTVRNYINGALPLFIEYCSANKIKSFASITHENFINFNAWLKNMNLSAGSGFRVSRIVEEIIKVGQIKGWAVPKSNIFAGVSSHQFWAKELEKESVINRTKPIPKDIFDRILYCAVHDEKDILTKAGIIIQSQTGLRISEVLSIRQGCVKTTKDGFDYMEVMLSKTEKGEPSLHKVFINELTKGIIHELSVATKKLRMESGLKELFLIRHQVIGVIKSFKWTEVWLPAFIERHNIRDNKGELYTLKSHQFRATFVRELVKQKVPIAFIMKQYAHVSIEMTSHYLALLEEEVKEVFTDIALRPESKIAGIRAEEIKNKLNVMFNGKTESEIDDIISTLSKSMSFNPLPTGVCLYDFRRGNCTTGDGCFFYNCPNYITDVQFLPVLRAELDLLELEMARLKALGHEREWERQQVKAVHLRPLVEKLEAYNG